MANEKRLIYLDDIKQALQIVTDDTACPIHIAAEIDQIIELADAVDAVEVVRCKDCDNTCPGTFGMVCTVWGSRTDPDGWCYKGERRDGE